MFRGIGAQPHGTGALGVTIYNHRMPRPKRLEEADLRKAATHLLPAVLWADCPENPTREISRREEIPYIPYPYEVGDGAGDKPK